MSSTARDGVRTGMPAGNGEAASLVESAMLLRWRAPELALLLADRAVAAAADDQMAVLRADHLAVFALNRLGRHGEAAHRLLPAIWDDETPAGLRHELHVELAHCAAALGEPAAALGAVHAVLAAGDDVAPVLRGTALVAAAEASDALGRGDLFTPALEEADELYREDPALDRDTALLLRATARAAHAARHRRCGAAAEAEAHARAGRELLAGLADPEHDSGEVRARLMLEIVLAMLDRDEGDAAMQEVRPLLRRPVRAAAAGAVGRLRLALATRVHLAEGRHEPALTLLADAVEGAQRHGMDAVLAECLEGLSHVHEARGEFADALYCVRAARAAERRHSHNVEVARSTLLAHCGAARREVEDLVDQVATLLGNGGTGCSGTDSDTELLNAGIAAGIALHPATEVEATEVDTAEAESQEAETAEPEITEPETTEIESGEAETAEVETEDVEPQKAETAEVEAEQVEPQKADTAEVHVAEVEAEEVEPQKVDTAEVQAEQAALQEVDTAEVEADQAECREADAAEVESLDVETAEVECHEPSAPPSMRPAPEISRDKATPCSGESVNAAAADPIVTDAGSASQKSTELLPTESLTGLAPWGSGARHRRGAGTLVCVSDLLPASALSAGRSGRRRAEEPVEERPEDTPTAEIRRIGDSGPDGGSVGTRQTADHPDASPVPASYPLLFRPPLGPSTALEREATDAVPPEDTEDSLPTRRLFPASGPPPAPTPRAMEWEPGSAGSDGEGDSRQMGLGDLLAEALAAYQESRQVRGDGADLTGPRGDDGCTVGDVNSQDAPPYRGPGTRWTSGLQLAPPIDRREDDPSEALTNPLLRLPDLTAEPLWIPSETGRRSAAGD
ncbi:MAG: hypothetical protein M3228_03565 [Actinomycetota bacterium]|nr:hypothetical protein [Actinomycetota bacterium]